MKTLLVPIDGSAGSRHAVEHAAAIATSTPETRLLLLNVQQGLDRHYVHGLNSQAARSHLRARGEKETADARALLDRRGCGYEFLIAFGNPAAVIARVSIDKHCSAIVMGSRGLGRLKRFLLGSTSDAVQQSARVPVTVVT